MSSGVVILKKKYQSGRWQRKCRTTDVKCHLHFQAFLSSNAPMPPSHQSSAPPPKRINSDENDLMPMTSNVIICLLVVLELSTHLKWIGLVLHAAIHIREFACTLSTLNSLKMPVKFQFLNGKVSFVRHLNSMENWNSMSPDVSQS